MVIRFLRILLGYTAASISTGIVVGTIHLLTDSNQRMESSTLLTTWAFVSVMVAVFAGPWAAAVIAVGERKAIQRKRYYGIAGIVIGTGLGLLFYIQGWFPFVGFGYGAVAGLIYWRIAGITAGKLEGKGRQVVIGLILALGLWSFYIGYGDMVFLR